MTQIVLATDVPDGINTLERHLAWAGFSLAFVNPTAAVLETPDRAEKVAQAAIFQAADNTYRLLVRACLPLDFTFMSDRTRKAWQFAQEVSNVALPAAFKED